MGRADLALVVGIARYPSLGGDAPGDLHGPVNDARAFADWLANPTGGALPAANLRLVTSDQIPDGTPIGPILRHLHDALDWIKAEADRIGQARRLYLYVAGHGLGRQRLEGGLYLTDAAPEGLSNLFVSEYFNWFASAARFEECVLFCDACMDQGRLAAPAPLHWRRAIRRGGHRTRVLGAYAARFAGRAVERRMVDGRWHGAFSYALMLGLAGAAATTGADSVRRVTTDSLRDDLIAAMRKLLDADARGHPGISTEPDFGPFDSFVLVETAPEFRHHVDLRLPDAVADATLTLADADLASLGVRTARGGRLTLDLTPGVYALSDAAGWEGAFEVTGAEAEVDLR